MLCSLQVQLQKVEEDLSSRAVAPIKKLLEEAGLDKKDVNWLIVTGNPSK